jgi:hypothetical protein
MDVETIMAQHAWAMTFPKVKLSDVLIDALWCRIITTAAR